MFEDFHVDAGQEGTKFRDTHDSSSISSYINLYLSMG